METVRVRVAGIVDAPPQKVYDLLRDYERHHPRILPKPWFERLEVEEGGVGAGTRVAVTMRVLATTTVLVLDVTEPEPGRVLREASEDGSVVTTFTLTPQDAGARTEVAIETEWAGKAGFLGFSERLLNPYLARRMYREELRLLAEYVKDH